MSMPTPQFGALQGVRVLDFTHMIAGPYTTLLMAYHGAEVIKVESRRRLDGFRRRRGDEDPEGSRPFGDFNRNKRDITLNLKHPDARGLVLRLAGACDVVVENYSAPVMPQLGLAYADFAAARPDIIMLSTQGMGQSGPYRDFVTWGPSALAFSGLTDLWNHATASEPVGSQTSHPDYIAGLHGLVAVLAALHYRAESGVGQFIEMAFTEATAAMIGPAFLHWATSGRDMPRLGNERADAVPHGAYRCSGRDAWCALSVRSDAEWDALVAALGSPDWAIRPELGTLVGRLRHRDEVDRHIEAWTSQRTPEAVVAALQRAGVPASVVATGQDLFEDEHLRARGFITDVDHPVMGRKAYAGIPSRLSATPPRVWRHAPLLGQDNAYVFGGLLGLSDEEIQRLRQDGVIA
jgi:crotonobetainyl-CoA:carnitine CoA-transferase CaiB-like acyl-CoA transferase